MEYAYYKSLEPYWESWKITRMIGEGAYGKVFEIEKEEGSNVFCSAMKAVTIPQSESEWKSALAEGMDDMSVTNYYQGFVNELNAEIALMSGLKGHSNIVSYEDHKIVTHPDGHGWDILIRMELLTPLVDVLPKDSSMSRDTAIQLGVDLCTALEVCERQRLLHRDIKPENIFISPLGSYKLGDFGIARKVEQTIGGFSKKGTYSYMAPEVYKGDEYGAGVDIYSLGMVLYRLLNRNRGAFLPPYPEMIKHTDRDTALRKRMKGEPVPLPVDAQDALGEVICKACAYDPKDRYKSATDFKDALLRVKYSQPDTGMIQQAEEIPPKPIYTPVAKTQNEPFTVPVYLPESAARPAPIRQTQSADPMYEVPPPPVFVDVEKNDPFESTVSITHAKPIPPRKTEPSAASNQRERQIEADRKWQRDKATRDHIREMRKKVVEKKKGITIGDRKNQAMFNIWKSMIGAISDAIQESDSIAMEVYLIYPTEAACAEINKLNPRVGKKIRSWYRREHWE